MDRYGNRSELVSPIIIDMGGARYKIDCPLTPVWGTIITIYSNICPSIYFGCMGEAFICNQPLMSKGSVTEAF